MKKVLISGLSSFTGSWIALKLSEAFEVHGICSNSETSYSGLRLNRLQLVKNKISVHYDLDLTRNKSFDTIDEIKPDVWIHHHHFMDDFRSPNYDIELFQKICIEPLPSLISALEKSGCQSLIFSGSFFEPGEGGENRPKPTPYGESKLKVWETLNKITKGRMCCSKVVIPNPTGPFENEDRLIPQMITAAINRKPFSLKYPNMFSDNLPVGDLANSYRDALDSTVAKKPVVVRPSGIVESNLNWINKVNENLIVGELGLPKLIVDLTQSDSSVNSGFRNPSSEKISVDLKKFWKTYASAVSL